MADVSCFDEASEGVPGSWLGIMAVSWGRARAPKLTPLGEEAWDNGCDSACIKPEQQ